MSLMLQEIAEQPSALEKTIAEERAKIQSLGASLRARGMAQERLAIFCRRKHERNNMHEDCHFLGFELFWIARRGNHCYRGVRPHGT